MHNIIKVEDAVKLDSTIFVDMRSPGEYAAGHIPSAVNIPLFDDEERCIVGTTYRQIGVEEAQQQGLAYVSAKLPAIVEQVRRLYKSGRAVVVYCWRGGMRSKSLVTVLDLMGISAYQLLGGYKAYRQHVLDCLRDFAVQPVIVVLCGSTGTGKTMILQQLHQRNIPVIDLEKLANHRGSVFGQIGLGNPATAQNFDARLLQELTKLNSQPYIVVECESKRIGNVYLPDCLFKAMQQGRKLLVSAGLETRVDRLIQEYLAIYSDNAAAILASIDSLRKRLGNKKTDKLAAEFQAGKVRDVVRVLLTEYYDPMYGYEAADSAAYDFFINADNLEQATEIITQYLQQLGR